MATLPFADPLQRAIVAHAAAGYRLVCHSGAAAQLVRTRRFRFWLFILLCFVPPIFVVWASFYYVWWYTRGADQTFLALDDAGELREYASRGRA